MITVVIEEMVGSDRVPDRNDYERALVGKRNPSTRAKWRSSSSAGCRVLEKSLTLPTLLEMAIYQQLTNRLMISGWPDKPEMQLSIVY